MIVEPFFLYVRPDSYIIFSRLKNKSADLIHTQGSKRAKSFKCSTLGVKKAKDTHLANQSLQEAIYYFCFEKLQQFCFKIESDIKKLYCISRYIVLLWNFLPLLRKVKNSCVQDFKNIGIWNFSSAKSGSFLEIFKTDFQCRKLSKAVQKFFLTENKSDVLLNGKMWKKLKRFMLFCVAQSKNNRNGDPCMFLVGAFINERARLLQSLVFFYCRQTRSDER